MKISIITVCYNSEKTIARTIESVLCQTYQDYEYIIIDGASSDGTMDIVSGYSSEFGDRLKVISEPDDGIYYAMNKGIANAAGELIGIINSDDRYTEDALAIIAHRYDELRRDDNTYRNIVLYGKLRTVDENGTELSVGSVRHGSLREEMIPHPTCFVTADAYREIGVFNTEYISAADYDLMLRMFESGRVHFEYVDDVIAEFTTGGMSSKATAYYDLLKVRRAHNLMTGIQYYSEVLKCRLYDRTNSR